MCDFALQVADAMAFLENRRIVHRSLAAHNVLVFTSDKVCQSLTFNCNDSQALYTVDRDN